ncbi:tRNA (guanine-N(7)-)-methyltransferase non-catalytic subunit wuho [Anopheles maculipalpis]|uniref:tRNA (guanine-N(7)-)-methyltransferase non-catalytic subunit wuho n=1 Tax=Anopheles maculipalpis TaxID=1496333 RepID=UPI0021597B85|nr:tRNA (guanine-N(7)-)-methyltransferase non-catalytic subunit wuho [Anopheles maculipalpis]
MYDLKIYSSHIVTAIKDKIVFFSCDGDVLHELTIQQKLPPPEGTAEEQTGNKQTGKQPAQPSPAHVVTFELCPSANVLVVSLNNKTLQCYKLHQDDGKLSSSLLGDSIPTTRTIVCMRFVPKQNVLIGSDKSDCFEFHVLNQQEHKPKWILGHMSQILGLAVSDDERFIITCDRDEKIKVSSYPDCHNIQCFCLGHLEYVGGIEVIPTQKLLSVSGDRTLRVWDFSEGKEIGQLSLTDPAVGLSVQCVKEGSEMLCVVKSSVQNKIDVALVRCDEPNASVLYDPLTVDDSLIVLSVALSSSLQLVLLVMEKESKRARMLAYDFSVEKRQFTPRGDHPLIKNFDAQFNEATIEQARDYSTLFKHSIDNLSEYFERKKQKIESKKSK